MSPAPPERTAGLLPTLGWAFYLACSWTWCIGMFLPVLLVRDYGLWGFLVFAAPNVVGAAAMGWVIRSASGADALMRRHAPACGLFAAVTIAFHLFFLQWLGTRITGPWWITALVAMPIAGAVALRLSRGSIRLVAIGLWLVSAAVLVTLLVAPPAGSMAAPPVVRPAPIDLLWLGPVCIFGFALCPYLDPTFLRARRACGFGQARIAFTLGFGVLFLAMIVLTLVYAPLFDGGGPGVAAAAGGLAIGLVTLHIALQSIFTTAVHWKEGFPLGGRLLFVIPLAGLVLGLPALHGWDVNGMPSREVVYRVFMACYGLLFPAYVWLCVIPTADGHSGLGGQRGRWKLRVWSGTVGLAAPCYWMGFIVLNEFFLALGLVIVLLGRLAVRARPAAA